MKKKKKSSGKITSDNGIRNCLVPTWLIIPHISLCGRSFWRRLFVSRCDWNSNDCRLARLFAQREAQEDILQYHRRSRGDGASDHAEVHLSSVPVLLGCRSFGPLGAHCLSDVMAIVGRCCVQGCVAAQLVLYTPLSLLSVEEAGRECEVTDGDTRTHPRVIAEVRLTPGPRKHWDF